MSKVMRAVSETLPEADSQLHALFNPRSIAIIGASPDPHRIRGMAQNTLKTNGYSGKVYPVNPSHEIVQGVKAYPSVAALPERVDLALISLPDTFVIKSLQECHDAGIPAAVVFSAGSTKPTADGEPPLHEAVATFARRTGMRIIGPNTEGFYNVANAIAANFNPAVANENGSGSRDLAGKKGLAIVSHSGGLAFGLYMRARDMHIPVRFVIGTANESDVEALEVAEYLIRERQSTAILMFLEGLKFPDRFERVAALAADAGIPLIIMKIGASEASIRAAVSHTGHLTGAEAAYDAMFRRYGVIRVNDPDAMLSIAAGFCQPVLPKGNRVCILTSTGGTGAWIADLCAAHGLQVPETDPTLAKNIAGYVPESGAGGNPIDVTASINDDGGVALAKVLGLIKEVDYFDSVILIFNLAFPGRIEKLRPNIEKALADLGKPVLFMSQTNPESGNAKALAEMNIRNFSFRGCAQALDATNSYRLFQQRWKSRSFKDVKPAADARRKPTPRTFQERRDLLLSYDIPMASEHLAKDEAEALKAAETIGYPVAVKIESKDLPHKSDVGGVILNVKDAASLREAWQRVLAGAKKAAPSAIIDGVAIQKMAASGTEMVLGAIRDPDFGPMIMLGFGGIYVEILRDTVLEPAPIGPSEARDMVQRLKAKMLLDGVRGERKRDIAALEKLIVNISRLMMEASDDLLELEMNPVIVHAEGEGLTVVDSLFVSSAT